MPERRELATKMAMCGRGLMKMIRAFRKVDYNADHWWSEGKLHRRQPVGRRLMTIMAIFGEG